MFALNWSPRPLPLAKAAPPATATRAMTMTAPHKGSFLMPTTSSAGHRCPWMTLLGNRPSRCRGWLRTGQGSADSRVEPRFVTGPNHIDHKRRREGPNRRRSGHGPPLAVPERGPGKEVTTEDDPGPILLADHRPVGKIGELGLVQSFPPVGIDPLPVQRPVHVVGPGRPTRVYVRPCLAKAQEVFAPALRTGPVAGSEGCGLVQEEELGEPARAHQLPAPALELEPAGDPPPDLPRPDQPAVVVVQHAPVAEQEPPGFGGDDVPERGDSVASRHSGNIV